jgi:NAD(P)-dependent dehydrogenase (short-subunit alcohol dehydrogenase family)
MKSAILVVGAAGGVGLEVVKLLLAKGYQVVATVLNDAEAEIVKSEAQGVAHVIKIDLSDADSVKLALTPVLDLLGVDLAGVAVCAGIALCGPLETAPLANLRKTLEINTVADVAVYQSCMPYLRQSQGRIVLVVSNAGRIAIPFLGHYVASKFALEGLGDVMRREAAKFGVKVCLIEPGSINTGMQHRQAEALKKDMLTLTDKDIEDYGHLYHTFAGLLQGANMGMDPIMVAQTILDALEDEIPQTRYQIGQDAVDSINMAFTTYRTIFPEAGDGAAMT